MSERAQARRDMRDLLPQDLPRISLRSCGLRHSTRDFRAAEQRAALEF
jgi:hypothetical protein